MTTINFSFKQLDKAELHTALLQEDIQRLELEQCQLKEENLKLIVENKTLRESLKYLNISRNDLSFSESDSTTENAVECFRMFSKFVKLSHLNINYCKLTDKDGNELLKSLTKEVRCLSFIGNSGVQPSLRHQLGLKIYNHSLKFIEKRKIETLKENEALIIRQQLIEEQEKEVMEREFQTNIEIKSKQYRAELLQKLKLQQLEEKTNLEQRCIEAKEKQAEFEEKIRKKKKKKK